MKYVRKADHIIARLYPGEKVHDSLAGIVEKEGLKGAVVVCGIGMLTDFTLGYFSKDGYLTETFDTPHELVSMQGTIAFAEDGGSDPGQLKTQAVSIPMDRHSEHHNRAEPRKEDEVRPCCNIHLHTSLAGPDHRTVGGHLEKGEVMVLNEIALYCPEGLDLRRRQNPQTGLFELEL